MFLHNNNGTNGVNSITVKFNLITVKNVRIKKCEVFLNQPKNIHGSLSAKVTIPAVVLDQGLCRRCPSEIKLNVYTEPIH